MNEDIHGVLLAGGKSRRFGSPKSFATYNDVPFYKYSLEALRPFCVSITIVTSEALLQEFIERHETAKIITDHHTLKGKGPLAGIYSAMEASFANWYAVLPTDVPFIRQWVLSTLIRHVDESTQVIFPVVNGRNQPLIGLYHVSVKDKIKGLLLNGKHSMRDLFETVTIKKLVIEDEQPFLNINREDDLPVNNNDNK